MALKTLPSSVQFRSVEWQLIQPAQVNRSAYTGRQQVMGLPGPGRWMATVQLIPFVSAAHAKAWRGFLASLEGQVHTFNLPAVTQSGALGSGDYRTHTLTDGRKQMVMMTGASTYVPPLRATSSTTEDVAPYCEVMLTADTVSWIFAPNGLKEFPPFTVEEVV